MDSDLLSDSLSSFEGGRSAPLLTYSEKFHEHFPYYLAIGMTEEQYWDKDCALVKAFREADRIRQERRNQEMWLQGAYFYHALADISPIIRAFAKKGTKAEPYLSEPFALGKKQAVQKEERREKAEFDRNKAFMERFMVNINKKFEGK